MSYMPASDEPRRSLNPRVQPNGAFWGSRFVPSTATDADGRTYNTGGTASGTLEASPSSRTPRAPKPADDDNFDVEAFITANGFGWLSGDLLDKFGEFWDDTGNPLAALGQLRQTGLYKQEFKGIYRNDGTLRMTENEYLANKAGFGEVLQEFGFNPNNWKAQYSDLIGRDVSADEFYRAVADGVSRFREPGSTEGIGDNLLRSYVQGVIDTGSADQALEAVRSSDAYEKVFAGNRRMNPDGTYSLRMDEADYFAYKRGWQRLFLSRGLNPEPFAAHNRMVEAIENELSVEELDARMRVVEEGILGNRQEVSDFFIDQYGDAAISFLGSGDATPQTALAMAIDPAVGNELLTRRIAAAQIGGEAAVQGFARSVERAEELARAGVNQSAAQTLYTDAAARLPGLSAATSRFNRGGVSLDEFEGAAVLGDVGGALRINRALQSEQASFGSREDVRRSRDGFGLSGLSQR